MASMIDSPLFGDLFSTAEMRRIWSDETMIQRWLDVEAALARAQARLGMIPAACADEITAKARVELIDQAEMKREFELARHPIMPLIRCFRRACQPPAGEYIHWGATTQDILDTGMILQLKAAHAVITRDLQRVLELLLDLARRHRQTLQVGRTHGQHALPITFGFKVAVWADEVTRHLDRLGQMEPRVFRGQFGGAVGTLASIGPQGIRLQKMMFEDLGLGVPTITWHSARDGIAEAVSIYAMVGSTLGRIANEIVTLQRTEMAELEEPFHMGKVGSSTMPHKRNPAMAEGIVAVSRLLQATVAPALAAMMGEHERDKRLLLAESAFVPESACLLAGILAKTIAILDGLDVHVERMADNVRLLGGLLLSEPVMLELGRAIGRQQAHDLVYEICMTAVARGVPLRDLLLADPRVRAHLDERRLDALLDPAAYTGLAAEFVDRVIDAGREGRGSKP